MKEMGLAQRRSVLVAQHARLRELILNVREAAEAVARSARKDAVIRAAALLDAVLAFGGELTEHLAMEENLLGPVLERIDAWGPVRLELMRVEHTHQRSVVEMLRRDRSLGPHDLAERALQLTDAVLCDMEIEDRDLLAENVLRDDTIVLDQSDC
jgi:hemerythrin-like domain-containing protein